MPRERNELYEFGDFRLNPNEHSLERLDGARTAAIPEKAFRALCLLVENRGHLLTKRELIEQIWPDSFVEENNLDKCIHVLRHALGERPGERKYIETVRKHGYRFVAEVKQVEYIEPLTESGRYIFPKEVREISLTAPPAFTTLQPTGEKAYTNNENSRAVITDRPGGSSRVNIPAAAKPMGNLIKISVAVLLIILVFVGVLVLPIRC